MLSSYLSLALVAAVHATPFDISHALTGDSCKPCAPNGATGTNPPKIGPDLKNLFIDVLASVKDIHWSKREVDSVVTRATAFCCVLDCVNVHDLNIPMCYDKFTTQYAFPDGSYGSLTTGDYTQDGTIVNLINGSYTKPSGEKGDIYSADPGAKPNTATLSIPPQFTGTGVGTAIPATELGSIVPVTTSMSGPAQTNAATTGTNSNAAPSVSSKGVAGHISADSSVSFGMSIFSAFMYAIYAL